jgi:MFS transporter, putative metabolite:H+ symporter
MGLAYGTGNFGKIISPLGLALIIGAGDLIKPAANLESLGLAFSYFAFWYVLGALAFWLIGVETKGRTFEEMETTLAKPAPALTSAGRVASAVLRPVLAPRGAEKTRSHNRYFWLE